MTKPQKMQKANVKIWLDALKSGKYRKCEGALYHPPRTRQQHAKYCALGVAQRLFINTITDPGIRAEELEHLRKGSNLSYRAAEFYGSDLDHYIFVDERIGRASVIALNDEFKFSFKKIAKVIEKYLKKRVRN